MEVIHQKMGKQRQRYFLLQKNITHFTYLLTVLEVGWYRVLAIALFTVPGSLVNHSLLQINSLTSQKFWLSASNLVQIVHYTDRETINSDMKGLFNQHVKPQFTRNCASKVIVWHTCVGIAYANKYEH